MARMLLRLSFITTLPVSVSVTRIFKKVKLWCRNGVMMFFLSLMAMPSASARRYRLRLMSSSSSKELLITYPSSIYRPYPWMPRTSFT